MGILPWHNPRDQGHHQGPVREARNTEVEIVASCASQQQSPVHQRLANAPNWAKLHELLPVSHQLRQLH
jgi:hypothetical protein